MGRPSDYSPEVAEDICAKLASGRTLRSICAEEHMPHFATVYRWMEAHKDFRDASARARNVGTHALADQCIEIADDAEMKADEKRVRIDTRLRLIGKWNAKNYGDRVEIAGDPEAPLTVTDARDQLARLVSGHAAARNADEGDHTTH